MKDSSSFTVPCSFEDIFIDRCLCDLGSSMHLMSLSFYRKLKFAKMVPTTVVLQLTDHSVRYLVGVVENMLVKVGKFYFSTDCLVLDM